MIVSDMSVVQYLALYYIAFTLQELTREKSDSLGPKLGARAFMGLGSFSIDDGNGSENVSFKMNSLFFNLCRVYFNLLNMASVGEFHSS